MPGDTPAPLARQFWLAAEGLGEDGLRQRLDASRCPRQPLLNAVRPRQQRPRPPLLNAVRPRQQRPRPPHDFVLFGEIDMKEGTEGELPRYPSPNELWNETFAEPNAWRDRFAAIPFEDNGGYFQGPYYQDIAIERVLEAVVTSPSPPAPARRSSPS